MSTTTLNYYRLLDDLEIMFFSRADDKRPKLVFERCPEIPQFVRADEVKLRQVLTNLLSNTLESTSQGIVLRRTDAFVHSPQGSADLRLSFTIEDTGPGMAAQDAEAAGAVVCLGNIAKAFICPVEHSLCCPLGGLFKSDYTSFIPFPDNFNPTLEVTLTAVKVK